MANGDRVLDDEILLIRIPRFDHHLFQPPDHISSGNFKLGKDESGLSVYRRRLVTEAEVLASATKGVPEDYLLVSAVAAQVRATQRLDGACIGFDVVPDDPNGDNPGHAEIRLPPDVKWTGGVAKCLRDIFQIHNDR